MVELQSRIAKVKQMVEGQIEESLTILTEIYNLHLPDALMRTVYQTTLQDHINSAVAGALRGKEDEFLLREIVTQWEYYKRMASRLLRNVFFQLTIPNDWYATETAQRYFYNEVLRSNVQAAVMLQINKMREGESIPDGTVLKNVVRMLCDLGVDCYRDFELAIFENTTTYYSRKSASWICEYSGLDYLLKVVKYLRLETETIVMYCVHQRSRNRYVEMVENELLCNHESQLLDCHPLLRNEKMDDLSEVFELYSGIDRGIQLMAEIFKKHVTRHGTSLVKHGGQMVAEAIKANNQKEVIASEKYQFVRSVSQLHQNYLQCVEEKLMNHRLFKDALTVAFQRFCNEQVAGYSIWELLVTFCDNILTNRSMTYVDVEDALEKVAKLFPYVYETDVIHKIAEFYREKLGDRLLYHKSSNVDYEKSMLDKLKCECGRQFTNKMEGMLTDWALTMKTQSNFEEYLRQNPPHPCSGIEFSVTVLTSFFWPSYRSPESFVLPVEMVRQLESFKEFYSTEKMNRKLTWKHYLGTCIIIGRFEQGEIQIVGTPCQASVLLLFNETERLSFLQVKSQLNLEVEDTITLLKSVACSTYKILSKLPDTHSVIETDYFEFNENFSCNKRKIRLSAPTAYVKKNVGKAVFQDRHYIIDASIIRIMKSRKELAHKELVVQCIEEVQNMFTPQIKEIKRSIENLINREFIKRDEENPRVYNFLP